MSKMNNIVFAFMLMTVLCGTTSAAELHVGSGYTYSTIQGAVDAAEDGDVITVHAGNYNENVDVDKQITLEGESVDVVTVTAATADDHVFNVTADYVNISGFKVTGATNNSAGIYLGSAEHCNIADNEAVSNCYGIYSWWYSNNNTLVENDCSDNDYYGIYWSHSSNNNLIYNNYFNNTNNAYDEGANTWNIAKTAGTNIIGGSWLGGNYWSDYSGADSDGDGLGDSEYPITAGDNIDYYPLCLSGAHVKGDLNGDNEITPTDAAIALQLAVSGEWDENADVSGDGAVTSLDALMILQAVKEGMKPMITLSSDPDGDLLFYVTGEDGLFAYYYGFKSNDTMRLTHVIFENTTGNVEVVLFNDDFLPVQWILTNMTVVVYKLGEEPFDPHSAFHVAVYGDQEDNATIDIYPSNLLAVIDEMESETGQNFDNARAFLGKYNITTFDELVTIAQQSSPEQPRFIAAATGFSTSAAALSLAKENVTSASAGDVRSAAYAAVFRPVIQVAAGALAHTIARELDYGLGDPTGPVVDVLLCRGVAKYGICHYVFLRQGVMHCVSFCKTSLRCFTDICMPMEISAEVAGDFVGYFF